MQNNEASLQNIRTPQDRAHLEALANQTEHDDTGGISGPFPKGTCSLVNHEYWYDSRDDERNLYYNNANFGIWERNTDGTL